MAANVETMFFTGRTAPWHGLGTMVENAPTSEDALILAGLDWKVVQKNLVTEDGFSVPGFKANVRDLDNRTLGVVTDRYKVVQNDEAFSFTDSLLGEGVTYETAGSLQEGRRTWILAKLPQRYIISGDELTPYLVFMNSHDGTGAIKAAMTPIRVVSEYAEPGAGYRKALLVYKPCGGYPWEASGCQGYPAVCGTVYGGAGEGH